jgi:hypothetical protein
MGRGITQDVEARKVAVGGSHGCQSALHRVAQSSSGSITVMTGSS